jgi:hypothetical protein
MGLAAAAVFIFAAGSVVLRDQLGGGGGVREAVMADRAPIRERTAVTSEPEFAAPAPVPAGGEPGGAAPGAMAGGGGGAAKAAAPSSVAAPEGAQPPVAALEAPRAQVAEQQAAESARRREVASNKVAAAARVAARAPAEAVHLRGQVAGADSTTRADSATRRRWPAADLKLGAVVVTGMADAANSSRVGWISRCWRRAGSDTVYRFAHPDSAFDRSLHPDSTALQASGRGLSAWMTGGRLVGDSVAGSFQWRAERDSSGMRIRTPGRSGELRLRAVGDSLLEGRVGRGQRVRLEALSGCP